MVEHKEILDIQNNILNNNNLCIKNTFIDYKCDNIYKKSLLLKKSKSLNNLDFEECNNNFYELYKAKINEYKASLKEIMMFVDIYIIKQNIYDQIYKYIEKIRNSYVDIINSSIKDKRKRTITISCMNKNVDNTIRKHMLNIRTFIYKYVIDNYNIFIKNKN
jgi:hypothetical protein